MSPLREEPVDWVLVHRYVAGECTPEEKAALEGWMRGNLDRQTLVESAAMGAMAWEQASPEADSAAAWAEISGKVGRRMTPQVVAKQPSATEWHRHGVTRVAMGLAVAAAVLLAVGLGIGQGRFNTDAPVPGRVYATAAGQRLGVTLDDGTVLTLAPGSRLQVSATFGQGRRDVSLDGEAYFVVKHDAQRPFAVHMASATVTDIGTKFDIRAYDAQVRVAVVDGKILLNEGRKNAALTNDVGFLTAGDVAEGTDTGFSITHHTDIASATAWLQGGLVFNATPLREAIKDIGRTYGIQVTVADTTLALKRVTGSFSNESVDEVLAVVTQAIGAEYQRTGQSVVIRRATDIPRRPTNDTRPLLNTVRAGY